MKINQMVHFLKRWFMMVHVIYVNGKNFKHLKKFVFHAIQQNAMVLIAVTDVIKRSNKQKLG